MNHLRFCKYPNCSAKVHRGYCPIHEEQHRREVMGAYGAAQPAPVTTARVLYPATYGRRWRHLSKRFLAAHPFCIDCIAEGRPTGLASEVDHQQPHRGDRELFWDEHNWQPRCKEHHSRKTAREVGLGGAH